jgi:stearoyl-CoA desaturase (delta-9 desaturase)
MFDVSNLQTGSEMGIAVWQWVMHWVAYGVLNWTWWQILLYVLITTHLTIMGVTLFLHRSQAHRSLELHPILSHFFRFWLWLSTGMVTKEWTAVHRKHHAKCETEEDPHSPQTKGIRNVLWRGVELYRIEAKNPETLAKYGQGTPDDWLERHVYAACSWQGTVVMLAISLILFGGLGLSVWALQMMWIPLWAAGVINGIGHYWGYRNFESVAPDTSTNISPIGILIGGEELHNNHHTYPTSAKFAIRPYEFDVGWLYICIFRFFGLATVKKTAPQLRMTPAPVAATTNTLEALVTYRYEVMARYATMLRKVFSSEQGKPPLVTTKGAGALDTKPLASGANTSWCWESLGQWIHRDTVRMPQTIQAQLTGVRAAYPVIDRLLTMREELRQLWESTSLSREQLVQRLQTWCQEAENSGIASLREFSLQLRKLY